MGGLRHYTLRLIVAVVMLIGVSTVATRVGAQPAGGYLQSCRNSVVTNGNLMSSCLDRGQTYRQTQLANVAQCVGDIFNDDGQLRCSRGAPPPPGGYAQTCEQTFVSGADLISKCRRIRGGLNPTTLSNFHQCVGSIFNDDGVLKCSRGGLPPAGGYSATCHNAFMTGTTLTATCTTLSGSQQTTSVNNVNACRTPISNVDGQLTCASGTGTLPAGSYVGRCINIFVTANSLSAQCLTLSPGAGFRSSQIQNPRSCLTNIENLDGFLACDKGSTAPGGTYHNSCHDVFTQGKTLSATCRVGDGSYRTSSFDFTTCPSSVVDTQGILGCAGGSAPAPVAVFLPNKQICAGAAVPDGYIVVDVLDDVATCKPVVVRNAWVIANFAQVAINGRLRVCSSSPTPVNWTEVERITDTVACGYQGPETGNVKEIIRRR